MNIKQTKEVINSMLVDLCNSEESILKTVSRKQVKNCKSTMNDLYILLNQVDSRLSEIKTMQELKKGGDK